MRYFDTSFLVPLILPEATSETIAGFFETLPADDLAVSHWARTEFASLLAREVRMGGLEAGVARDAGSQFETMIRESFVVLLPNRDDFDRAKDWLGHFETDLRAGDALHLAIAGNRSAEAIYSLDKLMIAAGKTLGLPASAGALPGYDD
ncbi:MAG: type II toxin-antitoxin system VapC family toxin [Alphaproteobacteria bacterium]|nr:type II toxin-antitoxin system VapC family toxin [Alphaproteobacteria bacterium]MCY4498881.1 type II toxin-antitoxin system VapC family toxin [Rhodospirillaceae bacterium]